MKFYDYFYALAEQCPSPINPRHFIEQIRNVEVCGDWRFRLARPFSRINENTELLIINDFSSRRMNAFDFVGDGVSIPELGYASIRVNRLKPRKGFIAMLWRIYNAIVYDKSVFFEGWYMGEEDLKQHYNTGSVSVAGDTGYTPAVMNYSDYIEDIPLIEIGYRTVTSFSTEHQEPFATFSLHLGYSAEHDKAYMKALTVVDGRIDTFNPYNYTGTMIRTARQGEPVIRISDLDVKEN